VQELSAAAAAAEAFSDVMRGCPTYANAPPNAASEISV